MARPVFAANWKMNHGPTDAREFLKSFLKYYPRHSDRQVILFPSAVTLAAVVEGLKDRSDIRVGVQNIHWEDKGAFTGEVSAGVPATYLDGLFRLFPRAPDANHLCR